MFDFFYRVADIELFAILSCFFVVVSILSLIFINRLIPTNLRYKENPVLGNISSVIGIIYGVLVGLTALYLFNNNSYTTDAVQREANATYNIFRESKWLKDPAKTQIQNEIKKYLDKVINVEWDLMKKGEPIQEGDDQIEAINQTMKDYTTMSPSELLIMRSIIEQVNALYDARGQRINMSSSQLSPEIWVVVLIGTFLTLGINYLFSMNFYFHLFTVSGAALMAASMIFLLITLDRPFQGEFNIGPDSYSSVLKFINNK